MQGGILPIGTVIVSHSPGIIAVSRCPVTIGFRYGRRAKGIGFFLGLLLHILLRIALCLVQVFQTAHALVTAALIPELGRHAAGFEISGLGALVVTGGKQAVALADGCLHQRLAGFVLLAQLFCLGIIELVQRLQRPLLTLVIMLPFGLVPGLEVVILGLV